MTDQRCDRHTDPVAITVASGHLALGDFKRFLGVPLSDSTSGSGGMRDLQLELGARLGRLLATGTGIRLLHFADALQKDSPRYS